MVARPVDSAIVAARAPWRVKCSVVRKLTAAGRGSSTVGTLMRVPVVIESERRVSLEQAPRTPRGRARVRELRHALHAPLQRDGALGGRLLELPPGLHGDRAPDRRGLAARTASP